MVRVLGECCGWLTSSVSGIFRRGKDVLTGSLNVGLAELQLLIHVVFNGVKLLSQRKIVSWRISGVVAR